jgi:hypothetical protein
LSSDLQSVARKISGDDAPTSDPMLALLQRPIIPDYWILTILAHYLHE